MFTRLILLLLTLLLSSTQFVVDYGRLPYGPRLECLNLQLVCLRPEGNTVVSFDLNTTDGGSVPQWVGGPKAKLWASGPPRTNIRVADENGDAYANADRHYSFNVRLASLLESPDSMFVETPALVLAPAWFENFGHSLYALGAVWGAFKVGVFNGSADIYVASGDGAPVARNSLEALRVLPHARVWDAWDSKQCYKSAHLCRLDTNPLEKDITKHLWDAAQAVVARSLASSASTSSPSSRSSKGNTTVISVIIAIRSRLRGLTNTPELIEACSRFTSHGVSFQCGAHSFGKNLSHDIRLMQSTNVLLAVHGASLANSLFMRKGSSHAVEIVSDYAPRYVADHHEQYLRATDYSCFYWKIVVRNISQIFPSSFQQRNVGNRAVWGRDKVLSLKVSDLTDVLERVAHVAVVGAGGNETLSRDVYLALNRQSKHIFYSDR